MKASVIGIIVGAVAALTAGLIYLWKTNVGFREAFLTAWAHILNFFEGVPLFFEGIGDGISDAFSHAKTFVLTIMQNMVNGIIDIVNIGLNALNFLTDGAIKPIEHATFATETAIGEAEKRVKRADDYATKSIKNTAKAEKRLAEFRAKAKKTGEEAGENLGAAVTEGFESEIDIGGIAEASGKEFTKSIDKSMGSGGAASKAVGKGEDERLKIAEEAEQKRRDLTDQFASDLTEALKRQAQEEYDIRKRAIEDEMALLKNTEFDEIEIATNISNTKISLLDEEYQKRIEGIDAGLDNFMSASNKEIQKHIDIIALTDEAAAKRLQEIQDRILAIDAESEAERLAIKNRQTEERRAELDKRLLAAETAEEYERITTERIKFEEDLQQQARDDRRKAEKDDLEQQSKDVLAAAKKTIEDETAQAKILVGNQQDEINKVIESKQADMTTLDEQYKAFTDTADKLAVSLISAGEESQKQALGIIKQFYPEWQAAGKKPSELLAKGFKEGLAENEAEMIAAVKSFSGKLDAEIELPALSTSIATELTNIKTETDSQSYDIGTGIVENIGAGFEKDKSQNKKIGHETMYGMIAGMDEEKGWWNLEMTRIITGMVSAISNAMRASLQSEFGSYVSVVGLLDSYMTSPQISSIGNALISDVMTMSAMNLAQNNASPAIYSASSPQVTNNVNVEYSGPINKSLDIDALMEKAAFLATRTEWGSTGATK